ncbi:hypothetical protein [Bacteroides pyogenes]|nr:hypothetical protein [Bacteroides pyogenes]
MNKLKKDYKSFMGRRVDLPFKEMRHLSSQGIDFKNSNNANSKYVYVSYLDASKCSPCHLATIGKWEDIFSIFDRNDLPIEIVIIYAVKEQSVSALRKSYEYNGCIRHVYIDTSNQFEKSNKFLPKDNKLHTFLLNPKNEVVFIGDPTRNSKIRKLLLDYIENIL